MGKFLLGLVAFFSFTLVSFIPQNTSEVPNVTIKGLNGENVEFSTLVKKGRVTVVCFGNTLNLPFKYEMNTLADSAPQWQKKLDFNIVAIFLDDMRSLERIKSYVKGMEWEFPAYIDPNQDLVRALNFQSNPFAIIYDKDGKIAYTHSGYVEGEELRDHIKEIYTKK